MGVTEESRGLASGMDGSGIVSGFGVTLGSLYIEAYGYVSVLLENLHGMSCSGT